MSEKLKRKCNYFKFLATFFLEKFFCLRAFPLREQNCAMRSNISYDRVYMHFYNRFTFFHYNTRRKDFMFSVHMILTLTRNFLSYFWYSKNESKLSCKSILLKLWFRLNTKHKMLIECNIYKWRVNYANKSYHFFISKVAAWFCNASKNISLIELCKWTHVFLCIFKISNIWPNPAHKSITNIIC